MTDTMDKSAVIETLNQILEMELAGVVRYTHYSFMIYGYHRIPIVAWLRNQANEAMTHAQEAGEMTTTLGEHPSLAIGPLLETHNHDIGAILRESMEHERASLKLYYRLLELTKDKNVMLEEYARRLVFTEEQHLGEVDKMLRKPGDVASYGARH